MRRRRKLTIAYLGTPFAGWQRQPGQRTVQGELEAALRRITGETSPAVVGAGRTDAGVHARAQVAHVDLPATLPPATLKEALNAALPEEIRVRGAARARDTFHARHSATAKHYALRVRWGPSPLPWAAQRTAAIRRPADTEAIAAALALLVGHHDVASFTVPEAARGSTVRTLHRAWLQPHRRGLALHFIGDAFLRYQVRRMVGAALEVAWGRRSLNDFRALVESPRPGSAVWTAPARGLTLERVWYRPGPVVDSGPQE